MSEVIGWGVNAPITWSINTAGVSKPQRYRKAARLGFQQWLPTGHTFTYVPSGGDISIVFSNSMDAGWGAYGQWTKVVPADGGWRIVSGVVVVRPNSDYTKQWIRGAMAHEIGHALGVPHLGPNTLMGSPSLTNGRITPEDIAYEQGLQRPM